jgi:hypothetical protein
MVPALSDTNLAIALVSVYAVLSRYMHLEFHRMSILVLYSPKQWVDMSGSCVMERKLQV